MFTRLPVLVIITVLALLVAACGGAETSTTTVTSAADGGTESKYTFGEPTDPGEADQTVEITASDDFTFNPSELTVSQGETITFRVVNDGQLDHDFTLGDVATQDEHEEEMADMGGMTMPDEPNAIVIPAGETKELTWRFTEPGEVIYGCHQAGHYAGGMRGLITVES